MSWWGWVLAGIALAVLELAAPGWVFLGFAVGAVAVGLILLAGGPVAAVLAGSWPAALLAFAVLSGLAWAGLRRGLGVRRGQVRVWRRDIND